MSKKARAVDICTDASVKFGLGSWGAVIARVDGRGGIVEGSGTFRAVELDTFIAEARAIANGLHLAKRSGLIMPGERVVIRTDHKEIAARFGNRQRPNDRPLRADVQEARDVVFRLAREIDCRLTVKHIVGHSCLSSGDFLAILNARADLLCGRALETKRAATIAGPVTDAQFEALSRQLARRGSLVSVRETVARLTGEA